MTNTGTTRPDEGLGKGAVEDDGPGNGQKRRGEHSNFVGQLGHRDQDEMLKDNDTDFPGPDAAAEHSGR